MEENKHVVIVNAKEQYSYMSKELGIEPLNEFNEDWSIDLEIETRLNFRDKIDEVGRAMVDGGGLQMPEAELKVPLVHKFTHGQYVRRMDASAGQLIDTKIHMQEHPFFLMMGSMSILTDKGIQRIKAPYQGITKPGTRRLMYIHEDSIFITVHATDKTTVDEVLEDIVVSEYKELPPHCDPVEILKKMNLKIE